MLFRDKFGFVGLWAGKQVWGPSTRWDCFGQVISSSPSPNLSYLFPKNEYPLTFPRWSLKRSHTSIASDQWQLHNKSIINHGSLPSSISSSNKKFSNYVGLFLKLSFPFSVFVFLFMQFNLISSFPSCSE